MTITNTYGTISDRTAAYAAKELLRRGLPYLVLELFGQTKPMPRNKTKTIKFRRYTALSNTPTALTEGVTPTGSSLAVTDVTAVLAQYGDFIQITDVIADTHEDPVLNESIDLLAEQQAQMIEKVRYNVLKAGSNVFYANGSARTAVNTPITRTLQRKITRSLKAQLGRKITKVVRSTPDYGTVNVAPSFIALVHSDCEGDIRNMPGFTPAEEYGSITPYESEIGKCEDVRYVYSTIFESFPDAGGAAGTTVISTTGTSADVYPMLFLAANAYGTVPLKGKDATTPMVLNPNTPRGGDQLGQRGSVGWKTYQAAAILNDAWLVRAEVAASVSA